ncbi:IS66 family transposase [Nannocystaceae bacterium ST9]
MARPTTILGSTEQLATIAVQRCYEGLSYEAIAQTLACEGLHVAPATMRAWLEQGALTLAPLIDAMWMDMHGSSYLCLHAMDHQVFDRLWVAIAPERHVLYVAHDAPIHRLLAEYAGYLVTEEQAVHEHLIRQRGGAGYWSKVRRLFLGALATEPLLAREALARISVLVRREGELAELDREQRSAGRERQLQPIVVEFLAWCEAHCMNTPLGTPLARAFVYAHNHGALLHDLLRDARSFLAGAPRVTPRFEEREFGSTFASLIASSELHELAPDEYLCDLLLLWPEWPIERAIELAPVNWRAPLAR